MTPRNIFDIMLFIKGLIEDVVITFSYRLRFACTQARRLWSGLRVCGDMRSYADFDGGV